MNKKLLLSVNGTWNIANFRSGLVQALCADGWEVLAAAPDDGHVDRVRALGCRYIELPMDNSGTHPGRDLQLYFRYRALMRKERPAVFLGFTIKPNVYGSLAAHSLDIPVVNNIAGLGTAFIRRTWLTHVATLLYRHALRRSRRVFFQNEDDRHYFVERGLIDERQGDRIPGSGIDLTAFSAQPRPAKGPQGPVRFLFVGRVLRDKGIGEYVEAARMVRARQIAATFSILGPLDADNRTAYTRRDVDAWIDEGVVNYLGFTDDVRPHIAAADCIVLPSYREGVPRTLLEAASMARPLIATNAVGCRDVVDDGVNGYLVRIADSADLAAKCARFATLPPEVQDSMGAASRRKAEREFDEKIVLAKYLECTRRIDADRH